MTTEQLIEKMLSSCTIKKFRINMKNGLNLQVMIILLKKANIVHRSMWKESMAPTIAMLCLKNWRCNNGNKKHLSNRPS